MLPRQPITGPSLRRTRIRAHVTASDVARRMGVIPQRASAIEGSASVRQDTAARFLAAIALLVRERDGTTSGHDRPGISPDGGRVPPGPADHRPEDPA